MNFEQDLEKLEEISRVLRGGQVPLSQAITQFEEGIVLARKLEKELEQMERRVEILVQKGGPEALDVQESATKKGEKPTAKTKSQEPIFDLFPDLEDGQG